jgi:hypothetical protein
MFKSLLVAASIALGTFAMTPDAEAHTRSGVSIHFSRTGAMWRG